VLLGHELLEGSREQAAARIWRFRESIEWKARALFTGLAEDLQRLGAEPRLVEMASQAAADETRHASLCADLVDRFGGAPEALDRSRALPLGPADLSDDRRALYASVAVSCVTETLSTALLLEIRRRATDRAVASVVREILKDEVDHARIGWAHLAIEAGRGGVAWLAPHLTGMLHDALPPEQEPHRALPSDLGDFGILPPREVRSVFRQVASDVIFPGLERYGVDTGDARAAAAGF
jgi:hypothetical protein